MTARAHGRPGSPLLSGVIDRQLRRQLLFLEEALEDCVRDPSEPHVHELRLAARHLAPVLEVCQVLMPKDRYLRRARKRMRKLLRLTGPLRDLHVRTSHLLARSGSGALREALIRRTTKELRAEQRSVRAGLARVRDKSRPRTRFLDLPEFTARRIQNAIERVLARRHAGMRKRIMKLRAGNARDLHRARVAMKRYRNMVEAFHDRLPPSIAGQRSLLKRHQQRSGEWHDEHLLAVWLLRVEARLPRALRASCGSMAERVKAWCAAEEGQLIKALKRSVS